MSRPSPIRFALAATLALLAAAPRPAEARLAHSQFSRLLAESELICRVKVTEVQIQADGRGHVTVQPIAVFKGPRPTGPFRIEYGGEVHDQPMEKVGEERLLFLKKVDGKWTGTHYGRSYWPLVAAADPAVGAVTPLRYPMTMLRFGRHTSMLRPARFGPGVDPTMEASMGRVKIQKMIPLSAVEKVISDAARKPAKR